MKKPQLIKIIKESLKELMIEGKKPNLDLADGSRLQDLSAADAKKIPLCCLWYKPCCRIRGKKK